MPKSKNNRNRSHGGQIGQKGQNPALVKLVEERKAAQETAAAQEYELLKKAWVETEGHFDVLALRAELQKQAEEDALILAAKKFEATHTEQMAESERLRADIKAAQKLLPDLEAQKTSLESYIATAQVAADEKIRKEAAEAREKAKKSIGDAEAKVQREAEAIVARAKQEAERANTEIIAALAKKEADLADRETLLSTRETALNADRIEVERQAQSNERRREILKEKAAQYSDASPEKIAELSVTLENNQRYIESLLAELTELQNRINQNRLLQMRMGERTAADILKENEELLARIETFQNKCNEFTTFQLEEMKQALDEKPTLLAEIDRLKKEVVSYRSELTRYENAQLELEAVKAQTELVKSLNSHLKEELLVCKRTLEAQTGEICPNLTRIDQQERAQKNTALVAEQEKTKKWTLPDIIAHVRQYAATRPIPLYYTAEDLCAFVAGLASSKFSILQGLSGTGKTSLPMVFADAISGENQIVSVESSWRDRNELLGYYNDFNKKFMAKEFTCHLYRANHAHYADTPFFIVLDEMNLSRVEYYFADLLSVLENPDQAKWLVSLVDVSLERLPSQISRSILDELKQDAEDEVRKAFDRIYGTDGKLSNEAVDPSEKQHVLDYFKQCATANVQRFGDCVDGPEKLINGHTLRIPEHVWFIGTANQDESTFEITDKVYDRAQVLKLSSRAKSFDPDKHTVQRVAVSYRTLSNLFKAARSNHPFDYSEDDTIRDIDGSLNENFMISFGNRIGKQMNNFVSVYVAAAKKNGKSEKELVTEAIDYQIANKVLRKLEHVDLTTRIKKFKELRDLCDACGLTKCASIVDARIESEG